MSGKRERIKPVKIETLTLNDHQEVIVKITKEVLNLFGIEIAGPCTDADYAQLSVVHRQLSAAAEELAEAAETPVPTVPLVPNGRHAPHDSNGHHKPRVPGVWSGPSGRSVCAVTTLYAFRPDGTCEVYTEQGTGAADETASAALHRLWKLFLYRIFLQHFASYDGVAPAPWGILHGVRPTKIVHRWRRGGMTQAAILERLQSDYACSREKAELLVPMAFRQVPFLETSDARTVSIYVGIPFCLTRCLYCSFPSNVLPGEKTLSKFLMVFEKDLRSVQRIVQSYGFRVQNIYVGGGTPTSLPDAYFEAMLTLVHEAFWHAGLAEFTVEAGRPDSMSAAKIATMQQLAVTRVSVNPQTMQQKTLDLIGRRHTPADVVTMFHALRAAGIPHINMDVILGLPGETAADVADTMAKIVALGPDDITLHALAIKRGSRLQHILEERHVDLPGAAETRAMSKIAQAAVKAAGMQPYYLYRQGYMAGDLENIGCCRPGAEGMYNIQIMEEHQTILGIGGAAATKVVDARHACLHSTFNAKDLKTYLRDIDLYIEKRNRLIEDIYGEEFYADKSTARHA